MVRRSLCIIFFHYWNWFQFHSVPFRVVFRCCPHVHSKTLNYFVSSVPRVIFTGTKLWCSDVCWRGCVCVATLVVCLCQIHISKWISKMHGTEHRAHRMSCVRCAVCTFISRWFQKLMLFCLVKCTALSSYRVPSVRVALPSSIPKRVKIQNEWNKNGAWAMQYVRIEYVVERHRHCSDTNKLTLIDVGDTLFPNRKLQLMTLNVASFPQKHCQLLHYFPLVCLWVWVNSSSKSSTIISNWAHHLLRATYPPPALSLPLAALERSLLWTNFLFMFNLNNFFLTPSILSQNFPFCFCYRRHRYRHCQAKI